MSYRIGEVFMRSITVRTTQLAVCLGIVAVCMVQAVSAAPSSAAAPAPRWAIHSTAAPSNFSASDSALCESTSSGEPCDAYQVTAVDAGSLAMNGDAVTVTDTLPAGVTVREVKFLWSGLPKEDGGGYFDLASAGFCPSTTQVVRCELSTGELGLSPIAPDDVLRLFIYVTVNPDASGALQGTATVSGGGASEASTIEQNQISPTPAAFGVQELVSSITGLDGAPETQAGGHPYEFHSRIDLTSMFRAIPEGGEPTAISTQDVKDAFVDLPLGLLGSAQATPKCTLAQLSSGSAGENATSTCPSDTEIGSIRTEPGFTTTSVGGAQGTPLFNMVPEHGVAAEFGFTDLLKGTHVLYSSVVPSPAGYVLRTSSPNIAQIALRSIELTLYGDPQEKELAREPGRTVDTPVAFFTNPTHCTGEPLVTSIHIDSWQNPGRLHSDGSPDFSDPHWASATSVSPPVTGCNLLRFDPSLSVQPETATVDAPTGVEVDLKVPQHEEPGTLATPPLRNAAVTLPAGLTLNPAAATGLGACTEAQIALGSAAPPTCPESSKIGSVEVSTPALAGTLVGSVYLATQDENPFHALLAGYIAIDDPTTGVVVKIPGNLTPDPATGQITGVFDDSPQLPFSELKLHFFGGPRGELATPAGCGTFTTTSDLMPWSAPDSGPDATPSDSFPISTGCVNAFAPGFTAGMENPQAGGYSPFTLSLSRSDGEQNLAGDLGHVAAGVVAGKIVWCPVVSGCSGERGCLS